MRPRPMYALAFVLAFCSLSYQLVIATELSRILGDAIFVYPGCIGVFILAKGAASAFWQRRPPRASPLLVLAGGELVLTAFAGASVLLIRSCFLVAGLDPWPDPLLVGLVLAALIGVLTGQELPLLFYALDSHVHHRRFLLWDYTAALIAALCFVLILLPRLGLLSSTFLIAAINLVAAVAILWLDRPFRTIHRGLSAGAALSCIGFLALAFGAGQVEHRLHEATAGANLRAAVQTPYHEVLLFLMRHDCLPVSASDAEVVADPAPYVGFVTLNGDVQLATDLATPGNIYHALMVDPAVHFRPEVERALILGGGSGNAAAALLAHDGVTAVTMVEIDETFTELARHHEILAAINRGALDDERLTLVYDDAFAWVPRADQRFDLILSDFPAGYTVGGVRQLSLQFLRDLRRVATDHGIAVFQLDAELSPEAVTRFAGTAEAAGWFPLVGRKPYHDPFDTAVTQFPIFANPIERDGFLRAFTDSFCTSSADERVAAICRTRFERIEGRGDWLSLYGAAGARDLWALIVGKPYYKHRHVRYLTYEACRDR